MSAGIAARIVRDGYGTMEPASRFKMADGTIRMMTTVLISEVRIGRHIVRNVRAGVSETDQMILAFPVVNDIAPFTIDTRAGELVTISTRSRSNALTFVRGVEYFSGPS